MKKNRAPVAEVVIGIQFEGPILSNKNIYDFYQKVKSTYSNVEEQPPLPAIIEKTIGGYDTRIVQGYRTRKFFINNNQTKLIQIQSDKLLFNWRRTSNEQEYPHFENVFEEFLSIIEELKSLADIDNRFNQYEVTYIDQIDMNDFGKTDYNPSGILNFFDFSQNINHFGFSFKFPDSNLNGNISAEIKSGARNIDSQKVLVFESTCRGYNKSVQLKRWFKDAHNELLDLFDKMTTNSAKEKWGLKL